MPLLMADSQRGHHTRRAATSRKSQSYRNGWYARDGSIQRSKTLLDPINSSRSQVYIEFYLKSYNAIIL